MKNGQLFVLFAVVLALLFGCAGGGPQPPSGVSAKAVPEGVQISWAASAANDVVGYNVYRSNAAGQLGGKLNPAPVNDLSLTDANVQDAHTYYYTVKAVGANNAEGPEATQVSATANTQPPSGLTLSINSGAKFTTSLNVPLAISANGAAECRFSNDGTVWGEWQRYAQTAQWTLADGDGQKTVYMECRNSAGVISQAVSSTIILKTTGPDITVVSPQEGDTLPTRFSLSFKVMNAMGQATCNANADGAAIPIGDVGEEQENTLSILLPDGGHNLYVQCTDEVGVSKSLTVKFETEENPVKVTINDGSGHTSSASVNLNLFSQGAAYCRFSNDGSSYSAWMPFAPVVQWSLSSGNGKKTVYTECKNSNDVSLGIANDSIILDTNPPSISLTINNGDFITYSPTVKLAIYSASSLSDCRFSDDGGATYGAWAPYQRVQWYSLPPVDGTRQVTVQCKNAVGTQSTAAATITLQLTPPQPPTGLSIQINGGSSRTLSQDVVLGLVARFADNCRYRNEVGVWTDWEPYTSARSWTLSANEGPKIVFYQCMNQYGLSGTAQASIAYGTDRPPTVTVSTPAQGGVYDGQTVPISFTPDGGVSPFSCTYYCDGTSNVAGSVWGGSTATRTLLSEGMDMRGTCDAPAPGSEFTTYVVCVDSVGKPAQSQTITFQWTRWVGPLK